MRLGERVDFRGAIFDADGTLLDSMFMWRSLGVRYLATQGIYADEELNEALYIMSFEQGCEYIKRRYDLLESVSEIRAGIVNMIEEFYVNEAELKSGVREYLELMSQNNIPMVIATSGDRALLTSALERNGISHYFKAIFTCSELHTEKNNPKIFLACADELELEPESIAVFDDALYALKAAKSAGFITIGIADDSNVHERKRIKAIADYFIEDFMQEVD